MGRGGSSCEEEESGDEEEGLLRGGEVMATPGRSRHDR